MLSGVSAGATDLSKAACLDYLGKFHLPACAPSAMPTSCDRDTGTHKRLAVFQRCEVTRLARSVGSLPRTWMLMEPLAGDATEDNLGPVGRVAYAFSTMVCGPEGNVTGVSFLINSLGTKRVELISQLVPRASTIGLLANPNNPDAEIETRDAQAAAQALGRKLLIVKSSPRRFPVGVSPTRQPLQPEAIGAVMEVTKWLKPSISVSQLVAARVCRPRASERRASLVWGIFCQR